MLKVSSSSQEKGPSFVNPFKSDLFESTRNGPIMNRKSVIKELNRLGRKVREDCTNSNQVVIKGNLHGKSSQFALDYRSYNPPKLNRKNKFKVIGFQSRFVLSATSANSQKSDQLSNPNTLKKLPG